MSPAAEWLTLLAATDGCFATDLPQPELDSRVVPDARSILRGWHGFQTRGTPAGAG